MDTLHTGKPEKQGLRPRKFVQYNLLPVITNAEWGRGARRARSSFGFPLPPLKFRTAGFPQYGFKWTVSGDLRRPPRA